MQEKALRKLTPISKASSDLTSKFFEVINKVAPTETIRVKNNANQWFNGKTAENQPNSNFKNLS